MLAILASAPAQAQLPDLMGLVNKLDVESGGQTHEVVMTASFDVASHDYGHDTKTLSIRTTGTVVNNLAEILVPSGLMQGPLDAYVNGELLQSKGTTNEVFTVVIVEFVGSGSNLIQLVPQGMTAGGAPDKVQEPAAVNDPKVPPDDNPKVKPGGGCLIATAAFGTEMAPQVQRLREIRDNVVYSTVSGTAFMATFNELYYMVSPHIADYQRQDPAFGGVVRGAIYPMVHSLGLMGYAEPGDELGVLGLGTAVLAMNLGLYVATPLLAIRVVCARLAKHHVNPAAD